MAEFDYGNARLRAMKSRLLSRQELEGLAESGSMKGFIAALTKTAYRKPVEAALARTSGLDCVSSALKDDLVNTLGKIHRFYDGDARKKVMIVLRNYDIHNLKTILRGLSSHAMPAEILAAMLPVGELHNEFLAEMAGLPDPRAVIDFLATMGFPYAQPLLKLRETSPGADINRMELALEQWSFTRAKAYLEHEQLNGELLTSSLNLDADLANLLTILRFANTPAERRLLREWLGEDDLRALLLGPGTLSLDLLVQAGLQDSLEGAIEYFPGTVYAVPLRAGALAYAQMAG
jgi:V/A-type H+/Na+-transporting ATPase subunit C